MIRLEDIARAAIDGEALRVRSLTQDWLAETARISQAPPPSGDDSMVRVVAAALVELFALRRGEPPPEWAAGVGPLDTPLYLLRSAAVMPRLRRLCELESPEPLRRRRIYAPPDYLMAA
ncbi:MAG: hypothetical protein HOP29_20140 [Phycisphaerales bacterium]|nr:hypothetical protein [Phycisphaerales bacterium]